MAPKKRHNICGVCGLSLYYVRLGLIDNECDQRGDHHLWTY